MRYMAIVVIAVCVVANNEAIGQNSGSLLDESAFSNLALLSTATERSTIISSAEKLDRQLAVLEEDLWFFHATDLQRFQLAARPLVVRLDELLETVPTKTAIEILRIVGRMGKAGTIAKVKLKSVIASETATSQFKKQALNSLFFITEEDETVLNCKNIGLFFSTYSDESDRDDLKSVGVEAVALAKTLVFSGHTKSELTPLCDELNSRDRRDCLLALSIIANLGVEALATVPMLRAAVQSDTELQVATGIALANIVNEQDLFTESVNSMRVNDDVRRTILVKGLEVIKESNNILRSNASSIADENGSIYEYFYVLLKNGYGFQRRQTLRYVRLAAELDHLKLDERLEAVLVQHSLDKDRESRNIALDALAFLRE